MHTRIHTLTHTHTHTHTQAHTHTLTHTHTHTHSFLSLGLVKDDRTLRELKVTSNAKMMVVGSTMGDVMKVQAPTADEIKKLQAEKPGTLLLLRNLPPQLVLFINLRGSGVRFISGFGSGGGGG